MNLGPELTQSSLGINHYSKNKDSCQNSFCDYLSLLAACSIKKFKSWATAQLNPSSSSSFCPGSDWNRGLRRLFSMSIKKATALIHAYAFVGCYLECWAESIKWFVQDQAFSRWFDLANPPPPPPPPPSASCLFFLVFLCDAGRAYWREGGRRRGVEEEPNSITARNPGPLQIIKYSLELRESWATSTT